MCVLTWRPCLLDYMLQTRALTAASPARPMQELEEEAKRADKHSYEEASDDDAKKRKGGGGGKPGKPAAKKAKH